MLNKPTSALDALSSKLSKKSIDNSFSINDKKLILLNFKSWNFETYKWIKKDLSNIFFKINDIKFFYTISSDSKSYKSKLIDSLDEKQLEFRLFSSKATKLKINDSTLINLNNLDQFEYRKSYNIVLFLQWSDDKMYIITASKTNYILLYKFFEENNSDFDVEFSLWFKPYTDEWFDFIVMDYILKDWKNIVKKDFSKTIESFINKFNS